VAGEFWQGAAIDRAKLAHSPPSPLDAADELKAVAAMPARQQGSGAL
jgi:hypothetical protein